MATPSNTTKAKPDNFTRTKSLGRKPKPPSSEDGSDPKPEKPIPNYLRPTISSRSDPVKFVKKNNPSLDDNQKLLRRRSFDRPPSTSASPRIHKSLNVSPSRARDRPTVPREKPVTAQRSTSFHGSRNVPKGGATSTAKSLPVAPKKSGLGSSSKSSKIKKEGSGTKKGSDKEVALDSASVTSAQEDHHEEILKDESDHVQAVEDVKDSKHEENKEVQEEVVQVDESGKEDNESSGPTPVTSPVGKDCTAVNKELEINEDKTEVEEKIEETKEQENKGEEEEEVEKKTDENETPEKVEEPETVEETKEEKEEENAVKEEEKTEVKEEEEEKVQEEEKEKVKEEEEVKEEDKEEEKEKMKEEETGEGKKKEIVRGQKGSPSAYNDVIASKIQENPRKNKVLALAGAFQTVIDYETAASK